MHLPAWIRGAAAAALLSHSTAWAQAESSGFELERLELNLSKGSLLSSHGELLVPGGVSAGLVGHYQHLPLVLQNGAEHLERVQHRASLVLAGSYGVLPWLEVGAQFPVVLWQKGGDPSVLGLPPLTARGVGTPVLQARLGLLSRHEEQPVNLAVDLAAGLPVGSGSALARDSGLRFRARATLGLDWGWLQPSLEAGVLLRPPNPLYRKVSAPLVPELRLGAVLATAGKGLRGELALRSAFARDDQQPSLELLGGVRWPMTPRVELLALGGPGLGTAPGTPTARVLLGLNFRMEPPPALERLTEAIAQFTLEPEATAARREVPRAAVAAVPTRELLPTEVSLANATPLLQGSVLFEPGRAELPGELGLLQGVLELLRSQPGKSLILLEGHAGQEDAEEADRLLPLKRAQAIRSYLAGQGVPLERMRVRIASPASSGRTAPAEGLSHARRVEVTVLGEPTAVTGTTP
jgi:OOP family OmpA-OmpF porin